MRSKHTAMKNFFEAALCCIILNSCSGLFQESGTGTLRIIFQEDLPLPTKACPEIDSFILNVRDSDGNSVYSGEYGSSPESLQLEEGSYTVEVLSREFSAPEFDAPQYGDCQTVEISPGCLASVNLLCRQLNSGVRLKIDDSFIDECPAGILFLKSPEGKLQYSFSEKRTAYFKAGTVSLVLSESGSERVLLSRLLLPQQVLSLNISAVKPLAGGTGTFSVTLDTSLMWTDESYVMGGPDIGDDPELSYNVQQAREHFGEKGVWVCGYIVGGDLSSSNCSFDPPFKSRTNLVLSSRSVCSERTYCLSVQLSKGDIRDELNLVDNPDNLGRKVCIKGDIVESYYGLPGLQNITEYRWR